MSRVAALVTSITLALIAPLPAQTPAPADSRYELPAQISFPEGIAHDASRGVFYVGSATDGAIARVNLTTRAADVVVPGGTLMPEGAAFPGILGMKVDGSNRLWVAGGRLGRMFVIDTTSGKILKQVEVPNPAGSLINDVVIVGNAGYFTDTRQPTLWRLEAKGSTIGDLEPWLSFENTALTHDPKQANLNGIAATPDGQSLIAVQMAAGLLFRIDVKTKAVSAIDTGGADLTGADGLVLDGRRLYVVRQPAAEIVTVDLSADYSRGSVVTRFKDPGLVHPATAAKVGDQLLVVNTQFNLRGKKAETRPFTVLSVPVQSLSK